MSIRSITAILTLIVVPLSARAADDENPLKKSKVGDFATYNKYMSGFGRTGQDPITYVVILNCDKENAVIIKVTGKSTPEKLVKIDLSKPFDPNKFPGLERGGFENLTGVKSEKVETGKETIKVGEHEYECTWTSQKLKGKAAETLDCEVEIKVWTSKDLPLGLVKLNWSCQSGGQKYEMKLELTESGNKK